ncbi:MAG: hypothetical protein HYS51_00065 [Candidatus Zambryskibacteria bacterium]|nr:hypothetical protein [Candidatus Zambryskibacteria bacterium]
MENSQKGFANIVLIVVIVAIVAVGGYFVFSKKSQEPNNEQVSPTTNLQTYTNNKYGFELKYANSYSLKENNSGISIQSSQSCEKILGTGGGQWPKDCFIYDLLIQKNKIEGGSAHVPSTKVAGYSSEKFELDGGMYDNLNQIYIQFEKGGSWYVSYVSYHSENKVTAENLLNQILSTFKFTGQAITQTPPAITNQTILNSLVTDWKKIGPNILPGFPAVSQAFYGYPDIIQFIGNNRIVISYQDDFNPLFAVLSYDTNQKQFSYLDGLRSSPFKVSETLWNTWRKKYGDTSFTLQTYQFSSTRTGDVVYSSDWKLITKNPFISSNTSSQTDTSIVTIDTLAHNPSSFLNKKVQITGKLILTGKNYFTDPNFALTDGTNKFQVTTWLVLEVPPPMPESTGGQPSTMATYLDKTVTLQGTVEQNDQGFFLRVTKAL